MGVTMYGTTMIGTLAEGVTPDNLRAELTAWEKERHVPGFQSSHVLVSDDGKTVINVAVFDDPAQDAWWQQHFVPMLADEPRWVDGDWIS
jgi:hypothetical protein